MKTILKNDNFYDFKKSWKSVTTKVAAKSFYFSKNFDAVNLISIEVDYDSDSEDNFYFKSEISEKINDKERDYLFNYEDILNDLVAYEIDFTIIFYLISNYLKNLTTF